MKKPIIATLAALTMFIGSVESRAVTVADQRDAERVESVDFGRKLSQIEIEKTIDSHYTIVLPESITFDQDETEGQFSVTTKELGLQDNQTLVVKIEGKSGGVDNSANSGFYLTNTNRIDLRDAEDEQSKQKYTVKRCEPNNAETEIQNQGIACNFVSQGNRNQGQGFASVNYDPNDDRGTSVNFKLNLLQDNNKLPGGTYKGIIEFTVSVDNGDRAE